MSKSICNFTLGYECVVIHKDDGLLCAACGQLAYDKGEVSTEDIRPHFEGFLYCNKCDAGIWGEYTDPDTYFNEGE